MKYYFMNGIIFLISVLLLPGCDDNDDPISPPIDESSFSLEISGDINENISGEAWFGNIEDAETGEVGFALWMFTEDQNVEAGDNLWFVHFGTSLPADTEYPIGDFEDLDEGDPGTDAFYGIFTGYSDAEAFLGGESGTITITTSTSNEVSGTFSFSAEGISLATGEDITAQFSGEFSAAPGPLVLPKN